MVRKIFQSESGGLGEECRTLHQAKHCDLYFPLGWVTSVSKWSAVSWVTRV
jgi:hypothetical protein